MPYKLETSNELIVSEVPFSIGDKSSVEITQEEYDTIKNKKDYKELLEEAFSVVQMRYSEQLNEIHGVNGYGLKAMFAEKYSIAYTACLDDIALGEEPEVNVSVYQNGVLVNIDLSYNEFLELYRAVKDIFKGIEKKYQQYLAEFSQHPTKERLKEIIENAVY